MNKRSLKQLLDIDTNNARPSAPFNWKTPLQYAVAGALIVGILYLTYQYAPVSSNFETIQGHRMEKVFTGGRYNDYQYIHCSDCPCGGKGPQP